MTDAEAQLLRLLLEYVEAIPAYGAGGSYALVSHLRLRIRTARVAWDRERDLTEAAEARQEALQGASGYQGSGQVVGPPSAAILGAGNGMSIAPLNGMSVEDFVRVARIMAKARKAEGEG